MGTGIAVLCGDGYCAEYQAVYDAQTVKPDAEHAGWYNDFFVSAKEHGYWTKLDWIALFCQSTNDNGEALINCKAPGTRNAALVSTPTHTAFEGFTGDGSSTGITSNWDPTTNGVNYTLDTSSFGVYIRTNVMEDKFVIGATNADNTSDAVTFRPRNSGNALKARINTATEATVGAIGSSIGFFMINRTASNATSVWRNGASIDTDTNASSEMTTNDIGILFRQSNTRAYWSGVQVALVYFGGVLTDQNKIDFNADFEHLMDHLGTGIQP